MWASATVFGHAPGGARCPGAGALEGEEVYLLASGLSAQQILEELPDLEVADVKAALRFASHRLSHPILAA